MRKNVYRNPVYVVYVFLGISLYLIAAELSSSGVGYLEELIFRFFNNIGDWLYPIMLVLTTFGAIGFAWFVALIMLGFKRYIGALKVFLATTGAYLLALLLKTLETRARPGDILNGVDVREMTSMSGVPSGHAAVATALAIILYQYVPAKYHGYITFMALGTYVARMYLGVHLPLDLLAGFGVGLAVASAISYILGSHQNHKIDPLIIKHKVKMLGLSFANVDFLNADARGSVPYLASDHKGDKFFIKVVSQDNYISDWLFKLYRRLIYRRLEDEMPFLSPKRQIEHESYVAGLAHARGANTPLVYGVFKIQEGYYGQVQQGVNGKSLDKLRSDKLTDKILEQTWLEVKKLHDSNIIHRDLRAANIIIDENKKPWIIDFGFAEATVDETQLYRDIVELIASTAVIVGPKRAVNCAIKVEGLDRVNVALPYLQYEAMSSTTAKLLKKQPQLLSQIRLAITNMTGTKNPKYFRIKRVNLRNTLILLGLVIIAYILVPQLSVFEKSLTAIKQADIKEIGLALILMLAVFVIKTISFKLISVIKLPFIKTLIIQLSSIFVNGFIINKNKADVITSYLHLQGHSQAQAKSLVIINKLLFIVGVVITLIITSFGSDSSIGEIFSLDLSNIVIWSAVIILVAMVLFIAVVPTLRKFIVKELKALQNNINNISIRPARAITALLLNFILTLLYANILLLIIGIFGQDATLLEALLVITVGFVSYAITPIPGGLLGVEIGLILALVSVGISPEIGVGIALLYRVITYWLPILFGYITYNYAIKKQYI